MRSPTTKKNDGMRFQFWFIYAGLVLTRLVVAISHSYVHPDEMFQSSEIIVGEVFGWETMKSWEFNASTPVRSIVPIYLFQAPLLYLLRLANVAAEPHMLFYAIRVQQFIWSLAIDGLLYSITRNRFNVLLYASSYTTMTYHTHVFSNSWETIVVLATLLASQSRTTVLCLGILASIGLATRTTFVAFMVPLAIVRVKSMITWDDKEKRNVPDEPEIQTNAFASLTFVLANLAVVYLDTLYYTGAWLTLYTWNQGIYTAWNNLTYNSQSSNLAKHGLHPRYTHLVNMVVLLGPAVLLVRRLRKDIYTASMVTGLVALSTVPHQEARFLLPCVALFFAALRPGRLPKILLIAWIVFNTAFTAFMGIFHQCGVVPTALHIAKHYPTATVTWTRSYPAPQHLLGPAVRAKHVYGHFDGPPETELYVAPVSRKVRYDGYELVHTEPWHLDLDAVGESGTEVIRHRGLGTYRRTSSSSSSSW